jgi:hypothetical protein
MGHGDQPSSASDSGGSALPVAAYLFLAECLKVIGSSFPVIRDHPRGKAPTACHGAPTRRTRRRRARDL